VWEERRHAVPQHRLPFLVDTLISISPFDSI